MLRNVILVTSHDYNQMYVFLHTPFELVDPYCFAHKTYEDTTVKLHCGRERIKTGKMVKVEVILA